MTAIVDKIRKLLALSRNKGATEGEAANAMAVASRLMTQHGIDNVDQLAEESAKKGSWIHGRGREEWEKVAASAVAKLFHCVNIHLINNHGTRFVGRSVNVEACEETFPWVCEQIEELYKVALRALGGRMSKSERGNFRLTFKQACAMRVFHRAAEIVAQMRGEIPAHMSLVVIDQGLAGAQDLLKDTPKRNLALHRGGLGTGAGLAAGEQIQLQRSVKS